METNTEQTTEKQEQAVGTPPETEQTQKPTSEKPPESTSTEPETPLYFTKKELDKAISEAEARVQAAKDKEIAKVQKEAKDRLLVNDRSRKDAELKAREQTEKETFGDTDELKRFQEQRRFTENAAYAWSERLKEGTAYSFAKKMGVDESELLKCNTYEEMEARAKELAELKKSQEVETLQKRVKDAEEALAEAKKQPQKIDSGITDGGGIDFDKLTPREKIEKGIEKKKKITGG